MHTKHSSINHCSQTQIIKNITTIPPNINAPVFSLTFIVESIYLGDLARFVITADESDSIWITDFEEKKKEERLNGVETAVDEVACEWEGTRGVGGGGVERQRRDSDQ